jgi:hypothetical protein
MSLAAWKHQVKRYNYFTEKKIKHTNKEKTALLPRNAVKVGNNK